MNQQPQSQNPFAAPLQQGVPLKSPVAQQGSGLWREGNSLVMHKNAMLPNICVKSGVTTKERLVRQLTWHPPWIAVTILAGLLIYVILAIIMTKRAKIALPLSEAEKSKRRKILLILWVLGLACLTIFIGSMYAIISQPQGQGAAYALGIIFGALGGIIVMVVGQKFANVVKPTKITDTHAWIKGVHPSILDKLPPAR